MTSEGEREVLRKRAHQAPQWQDSVDADGADESAFKSLTSEEAQALRQRLPAVSPWHVVAGQALVGLVLVVLWWLFAPNASAPWSALYGAAAVVLPNALMAWGLTRRPVLNAGTAVLSLMVWELIKMMLAMAILVAVVLKVQQLHWLALLSALLLCLKANWLALFLRGRNGNRTGI
ncbi:ATP synthase subunit I [Roseateles sp. BYS180W]|uniref:ATP synthase subunit I n=1 Tax=Roseateles rivi TaxID=3299028 RepID=A0ABW7FQT6_9BURK